MANSGTAGYFCGGAGATDTIDKWTFASDTSAALGTGLDTGVEGPTCMANSGTKGYICGGHDGSGYVDIVQTVTFSDDSISTLGITLSDDNGFAAGFANEASLGGP